MPINLKAIPQGAKLTTEQVSYLASRAKELLGALQARIDSLRSQVEDAKTKFHAEANAAVEEASAGLRDPSTDHETKEVIRKRAREVAAGAKHIAASRFSRFVVNIRASSFKSRQELLEPLTKLREQAEFLIQLFGSPAQALGRVALGEVRRTQYQLQLTGAGPVELESAAALAIANEDVVLAAAVVTVLDRMPRAKRPFSVNEFSTILWGKEHTDIVTKLKTVLHCCKLADIANREFETGQINQVSRISALLDERELGGEAEQEGNAA